MTTDFSTQRVCFTSSLPLGCSRANPTPLITHINDKPCEPRFTCRASSRSRSRSSKRSGLYDAMRIYSDHFRPLLLTEQQLEHEAKLQHGDSSRRFTAKRLKRLYSNVVYSLRPITGAFRRGHLLTISDGNQSADATVLSASDLLVVVPIGSDSDNVLSDFDNFRSKLSVRSGANTLPYQRAEDALESITTNGPSTPSLTRLLVSSFEPPDLDLTLADCKEIEPSKWDEQARECVTSLTKHEVAALLKRLPLNKSQRNAIEKSLSRMLSLIQGPPGTGKTVTAAHLVSAHVQLCGTGVLAAASSNVATDNLLRAICTVNKRLKVVRIGRVSNVDQDLWPYCLEYLLEQNQKVKRAREMLHSGKLSCKEMIKVEQDISQRILSSCDVIVTTCVSCGREELQSLDLPLVVIDEATQATETDVLVPLISTLNMAKQLVLVGDHHQLPPTVLQQDCALGVSLFTRLWKSGVSSFLLDTQYRMHPSISKFPRNHFYFGNLRDASTNDAEILSPTLVKALQLRSDSERVVFIDVSECEEKQETAVSTSSLNGTSFVNEKEAEVVEQLLDIIRGAHEGFEAKTISVISPYAGQVRLLTRLLSRSNDDVEVCTVDGFQGRENNIIILSCVRNNEQSRVGFLDDWRRLNVAITRAKQALIVVGNYNVLRVAPHWGQWLRRRHIIRKLHACQNMND